METKKCGKCGENRPKTDYYRSQTGTDGLQGHCKECAAAANREWRAKRKKERLEMKRAAKERAERKALEPLRTKGVQLVQVTCPDCGRVLLAQLK